MTPTTRDRLFDGAMQNHIKRACRLLRLPLEAITRDIAKHADVIASALRAFADAPPFARASHAELVNQLIAAVRPAVIVALTRLALATGNDAAWTCVQAPASEFLAFVDTVVTVALWNDLLEHVQTTILNPSNPCNVRCQLLRFA